MNVSRWLYCAVFLLATPLLVAQTAGWTEGGGVTSTNNKVNINDVTDGGFAANVVHDTTVEATATQLDNGIAAHLTQTVNSGVTNNGWVLGLFTAATRAGAGSSWRTVGARAYSGTQNNSGSVSEAIGFWSSVVNGTDSTINTGYGLLVDDVMATTGYGIYQSGPNDMNFFGGRVGIGTGAPDSTVLLHVAGNVRVDGNISAKYQDVAEWVPATEDLAPGTVVVLDPTVTNQVMPSGRAYDTSVAGVVASQPGIILGEAGDNKEQVATTGRVKVRVDATKSPIRIGDLLVSGEQSGMAMKSLPVDVSGVPMHRPGTVIGKALEPLDGGTGEILVLLSLQ